MQEQGLTRYDVTRCISHGIAKGDVVSRDRKGRDSALPRRQISRKFFSGMISVERKDHSVPQNGHRAPKS
jgi:hypothetical protein